MAGEDESKAEASAEKAYATAAEGVSEPKKASAKPIVQTSPEDTTADSPIEIPAVKPAAKARPKPAPASVAKPAKARKAKSRVAPKTRAAKPKSAPRPKPAVPAAVKKAAAPKVKAKPAPAAKAPAMAAKTRNSTPTIIVAKSKDQVMKISEKLSGSLHSVMTEAQAKAKEAFEKSQAVIGDYAAFTKGNVEAVVESGKILAGGLQDMSASLVTESRAAFESASADIKELAAAKSPTDLIQLQSEMFRKNFDSAVAYGSKNTEAMIKLASEAMAPISSRVSLAVEKVRSVAA